MTDIRLGGPGLADQYGAQCGGEIMKDGIFHKAPAVDSTGMRLTA